MITLEEIIVRVKAETGDSVRRLREVDQAVGTLARAAGQAGRGWDRGMADVVRASRDMERETVRAARAAARESLRAAQTGAREQARLANSLAREQEQASRRAEVAMRRSSRVAAQLAGDIGRSMTLAGVGIAGGLALATKQAVSFESAMAGVRKTTDLTDTEFAALEKTLRKMATTEIPLPFEQLAGIAEMGGQLGIASKDLNDFTRVVAKMAASTNLSADDAANAMARISNVMGLGAKDFEKLGSAIVDLGNKSAATEQEIVEFAQRLTGAAKVAGITTADVLGFSAAMASVGIKAEAGGTAFSRVIKNIANAAASGGQSLTQFAQVAGVSSEKFRTLFKADAGRAVALFVEGLATLRKQGVNLFPILEGLGFKNARVSDTLLRLAGTQGLVTKSLNDARPAWQRGTALTKEAELRFKTTASQLQLFSNQVREAGAEIGVQLLPMLRDLLREFQTLLNTFSGLDPATQKFVTFASVAGAAALVLGGQILGIVSSVAQLRAAMVSLGAVSGAAAGAGGLGALAARLTTLLPLIAEALPFVSAGVGGAAVGRKLADIQTSRQGLVSLSEAERSNRAQDALTAFQNSEPFVNGRPRRVAPEGSVFRNLLPGGAAPSLPEGLRRVQEARRPPVLPPAFPGARPSVPEFETKESRAAARKAAAVGERAAREALALAEERARNLAAARQDLIVEQLLARGETRGAFILQNRKPGVPDALSGRTFDTRQTGLANKAREKAENDARQRAIDAEREGKKAVADALVELDTRRKIAELRNAGKDQEADFQEFITGNERVSAEIAKQPELLEHFRQVFAGAYGEENKQKVEAFVDTLADVRAELAGTAEEARLSAEGITDSFQANFSRFFRETPDLQKALASGNLADFANFAATAFQFAVTDQAKRDAANAERLRQIRAEDVQRRQEAATSLDQRRRALRGGEFGQFAVSRETIDDRGRARQPFDMNELKQQFQQMKQLDQLEMLAGGVRDTFLSAFTDIMTGAKGFFSSLIAGFTATFQRIAAEFLASQAMNLLFGLAGNLFGGGGGGGSKGGGGILDSISAGFGGSLTLGRAWGGPVTAGAPYLVGERGPELFVPRQSGRIEPNGERSRGPVTVHMTVNTPNAESFRQAQGAMVMDLQRRLERTGRDR